MDDLDFDEGEFVPANGVWHIVDRNAVGDPQRVLHSLLTGETNKGQPYVIAFTDSDLAERFIERLGIADAVPLPFQNQHAWLAFLEDLLRVGYEHIGFDPEPGGKFADFGSIADLIQNVREALGGAE